MSTRIGKYIFEDNLEEMSVEKLTYLRDGCEHFIKKKHHEEIHKALTEINLRAHAYGFDIFVVDDNHCGTCLNEYTMDIRNRE